MIRKTKFDKIISIAWVVLFAFIFVSVLGVFASSVSEHRKTETSTRETLEGKYISFMGDSITTYQGWNNNTSYNTTIGSNAVWYTSDKLSSVNDTWWKKTVDNLDLKLCVNNSWSGSRVTSTTSSTTSAACMNRAKNLHNNVKDITPDIIVVYIGINDYRGGVTLGTFDGVDSIYNASTKTYTGNLTEFADAYATMVHKMQKAYPEADIYLCTLDQYNTELVSWNAVIKQIANAFDCNVVDFYNKTPINSSNLATYMVDGYLHPNATGMNEMYKVLKQSLEKNYD